MRLKIKCVKVRWYHKITDFFFENHNGMKQAELNNIELYMRKNGSYYLDIRNMTANIEKPPVNFA